jgi:aspartyl aminopeptidase
MIAEITQRIHTSFSSKDLDTNSYFKAMRKSFMLSADMAHGLHPNYSEKHHP